MIVGIVGFAVPGTEDFAGKLLVADDVELGLVELEVVDKPFGVAVVCKRFVPWDCRRVGFGVVGMIVGLEVDEIEFVVPVLAVFVAVVLLVLCDGIVVGNVEFVVRCVFVVAVAAEPVAVAVEFEWVFFVAALVEMRFVVVVVEFELVAAAVEIELGVAVV